MQSYDNEAKKGALKLRPPSVLDQFIKGEIDHNIAKCLDTLDRQGLKFLKETLRTSKMFDFTQRDSPSKKVLANDPHTIFRENQSKVKKSSKNGLVDQIHSKKDKHRVRSGKAISVSKKSSTNLQPVPKVAQKPAKKVKKNKQLPKESEHEQIEQEIIVCDYSPQKMTAKVNLIKEVAVSLTNFQSVPCIQQNKPFCKKSYRDSALYRDLKSENAQILSHVIEEQIVEVHLQHAKRVELHQIEKSQGFTPHKIEEQFNLSVPMNQGVSHVYNPNQAKEVSDYIIKLATQINNLSEDKRVAIQRILNGLEDPECIQEQINCVENIREQAPPVKRKEQTTVEAPPMKRKEQTTVEAPQVIQESRLLEGSRMETNQSKLRFKREEKASSLSPYLLKPKYKSNFKLSQCIDQTEIQKQEEPSSVSIQFPLQPEKISLEPLLFEVSQVTTELVDPEAKMIKLTRKYAKNTFTLKVLSNNGHPTLVALSKIIIYSSSGTPFQITTENLTQHNPRLVKMFDPNAQNEPWITTLEKAQINLKHLNSVGGVRIWNYYASQLESSKEARDIQIYIDQESCWTGVLTGGSDRSQSLTEIQLNDHFKFPSMERKKTAVPQVKNDLASWFEAVVLQADSNEQESQIEKNKYLSSNRKSTLDLAIKPLKIESQPQNIVNSSHKAYRPITISQGDVLEGLMESAAKKSFVKSSAITREKQRDAEMEEMLTLVGRKNEIKNNLPIPQSKVPEPSEKNKIMSNSSDIINDSFFNSAPTPVPKQKIETKNEQPEPQKRERKAAEQVKTVVKKIDIDDFLSELDDAVGHQFTIPELPTGRQLQLTILSNWSHQSKVGLNGVQFFNQEGITVRPVAIESQGIPSEDLNRICRDNLRTTSEAQQLTAHKISPLKIIFTFENKLILSLIRIWNYNGHRVHSTMGVKKCLLKLDSILIFSGEIIQCSENRQFQSILFTNNTAIIKRIHEKSGFSTKNQVEADIFRETLENFKRPITVSKEEREATKKVQVHKNEFSVKLSKRMCFEYDPPILPSGYLLRFLLHSSWGDLHFIGLNGIEIFDGKGNILERQKILRIWAEPACVSILKGYEGDKRVISNLLNGVNIETKDRDVWLSPLLSDIQKEEKKRPNMVQIEFKEAVTISGINIYNYSKNPCRGVRQFQMGLDGFLLYRGYIRRYEQSEPYTTVHFTREPKLLEQMRFNGYNENTLEQSVRLINEQKIFKQIVPHAALERPMTGNPDQ